MSIETHLRYDGLSMHSSTKACLSANAQKADAVKPSSEAFDVSSDSQLGRPNTFDVTARTVILKETTDSAAPLVLNTVVDVPLHKNGSCAGVLPVDHER